MEESKFILVELNTPYMGQTKWLFGSKKAIYDTLPANVVGIALTTLQNRYNLEEIYENPKCKMQKLVLHRTVTNRGKRK
jgi:hypothetical protein